MESPARSVLGTSARLTGRVAVGIVIVSGPTPDLYFNGTERVKVWAEVQNGLAWLGAQAAGGGVWWIYDYRFVAINVKADPHAQDREALWRDPTMVDLGYAGNYNGVWDYVKALRVRHETDWAYCAFFMKYPPKLNRDGEERFAYAGLPRIVMQYQNGGWGPDNIDRVFAHETGHIFHAPDEYARSECTCGGEFGFFRQPNDNCANCAPGSGVSCIMKQNDWTMCQYTPWHLGFAWPYGRAINGVDRSPLPPAGCVFNGTLYVFWKADSSSNRIYYSATRDGMAWPDGKAINGVDSTPQSVAAAVFANKLYVFWKADSSSNRIYYSASSDGVTWPAGRTINEVDSTPQSVAVAVFAGKLYVFWRASDASDRIYYSASRDGVTWPSGKRISEVDRTQQSVAVAVFGGKLYVFWKGDGASSRIYYSASGDGVTWPKGQPINDSSQTSGAVTACAVADVLYVFWRGEGSSNRIYVSTSDRLGIHWLPGIEINMVDRTPASPAAVAFGENPYLFWKADGSSKRIYFSP